MKWAVYGVRKHLIGRNGKKDVAGFHRHLVFTEAMVLEDTDMVESALDKRLRARLAIFLQEVLLEASCIHADADRAAVRTGRRDDFPDPFFGADITGVDAQACGACISRLERTFVVEMDVGDDGALEARTMSFRAAVASAVGQDTLMMSTPASSQRRI